VIDLDHATMTRFVKLAGERLTGDWVVLGGSVLPLLGLEGRVTVDIDVASTVDTNQGQVVLLMEIAAELGLPVETINQAGAFFLRDVPGWREQLVAVHRGPRAVIHVPSATLYVLTKLQRLSASDLGDCLVMLRHARGSADPFDVERLHIAIDAALQSAPSAPREERLRSLRDAL